MRHLKAGRRLSVTTSHRRAMMRNLVTSLIEHEQITCTVARAKELRKPLEKMITLGKRGDLHARRQALKFIKSKEAMASLFGELAERYQERNGGYSRIIKLGPRRLGDGAHMAIVQLIDGPNDVLSELKKKSTKKPKARMSTVLDEVSQDVSDEATREISQEKSETDVTETSKDTETQEMSAETSQTEEMSTEVSEELSQKTAETEDQLQTDEKSEESDAAKKPE